MPLVVSGEPGRKDVVQLDCPVTGGLVGIRAIDTVADVPVGADHVRTVLVPHCGSGHDRFPTVQVVNGPLVIVAVSVQYA